MAALAVLVGTLVAPAWSGEIYSWTDSDGAVHYSNTPAPGASAVTVTDSDSTLSAKAPVGLEGSTEGAPSSEDAATFSTQASLRRTAIERSMRDVERRLADVDGRLAAQARARTGHAAGSVSTGGVGTNADALLSPEEKALESERKELVDRQATLQADYAKLRNEVVARIGTTPAWWVEFRPGRR